MNALKKKTVIISAIIIALFMAIAISTVNAQGNETDTVVPEEEEGFPFEDFAGKLGGAIPVGLVVGFITSLLGYLSKTDPNKTFSLPKLLGTILFALFIGMIMSLTGWDYTTTETWAGTGGITIWIYWLAEIIAQYLGWTSTPTTTTAAKPT